MKLLYHITILLFINCTTLNKAFSQYNFRTQISCGQYYSPDNEYKGIDAFRLNSYGTAVQYRFYNPLTAKLSYNHWYGYALLNGFSSTNKATRNISGFQEDIGLIQTWKKGDIYKRQDYHFIDAKLLYSKQHNKHELYAGAGICYAMGVDRVILSVFNYPGYGDWLIEAEEFNRRYWGGTWEAGYNYMLFKNRINLGISFNGRYIVRQFTEYNLQLNMGYNFNFLKQKNKKGAH